MDQNTQTVIIDVTLNSSDASSKAKQLGNDIIALKDKQDILKASGAQLSIEYVKNAQNIRSLQSEQKAYIALSTNQEGSISSLRAQVLILTAQWSKLSLVERETTDAGKQLGAQIKDINDKIREQTTGIGSFKDNIGNYQDGLQSATGVAGIFGSTVAESTSIVNSSFNILSGVISTLSGLQEKFKVSTEALTVAQKVSAEATTATASADRLAEEAKKLQTDAVEAQIVADKAAVSAKAIYNEALLAGATKEEALLVAKEANIVATEADIAATQADALAKEANIAATEGAIAAKEASAAASVAEATATTAAAEATVAFDAVLDATGIGLIIALVVAFVAIIGTLISYFSDFAPIADVFKGAFSAIGSIIDVVFNSVVQFIGSIKSVGDLFSKIGDFISNPTEAFAKLGTEMAKAAKEAYNLKEAELQLQRALSTQDVFNAQAQQQIAALRLLARNRTTDAEDRIAYLKKATELEEKNYADNKKLLDQQLDLAIRTAANKKQLNADEIKDLQQKGIIEAQILLQSGRIGQDQFDAIKKADLALSQLLQQRTQIDEKNQNQADMIADRAEKKKEAADKKAEEARQKHETKLNEIQTKEQKARDELSEGAERSRIDAIANDRERELATLISSYDKRINETKRTAYTEIQIQKEKDKSLRDDMIAANADIAKLAEQLEAEKKAKIKQQNAKNALDDAKTAQELRSAEFERQIKDANTDYAAVHDLRAKQLASDLKFELQNIQLSEVAKEKLKQQYAAKNAENDNKYLEERKKAHEKYIKDELQREKDTNAAEAEFQNQRIQTLKSGSELLAAIGKQNSDIAKAAFFVQKAIAVAEIVIQTQRKIAAIELAWSIRATEDAAIPFVGAYLAAADYAAGEVLAGEALAEGIIQGGTVAATSISGFAKGGYVSGPGTGTSDSINAHLSNGESVINAKSTSLYAPILSAINQAGGGRAITPTGGNNFAAGGVYLGNISQSAQSDSLSANAIASAVASQLKNLPAPVVGVKEIISGINQVTKLKQRGDF